MARCESYPASDPSYIKPRRQMDYARPRSGQNWRPCLEDATMKKIHTKTRTADRARERLNQLMEAVAFVIAQRQMKRYWAAGHGAALTSII